MDLRSYLGLPQQSQPVSRPVQPQPQQQPSVPSQPSFWQKILPTVGGVLGGIGGELIDPLGGGIVGAGLGSALGKAGENATEGQSAIQGNDLTAGLEGAAGQGAGELAGGALGLLGGKLGDMASQATDSGSLVDEFGKIPQPLREKLNLDNSLNLADQAGIPKTAQAFATHPSVGTGSNGILNGTLDSIVGKTFKESGGGVDLSGFGKAADSAISDHPEIGIIGGKTPGSAGPATALRGKLTNLLQQFGFGGEGSLTSESDPEAALGLLRKVQDLGNTYKGSLTDAGKAQADVYGQMENFLKDKIYNNPDVKDAISNYKTTPEDQSQILKTVQAAGGTKQYADFITNTLDNATKASDITNVERQLIDMRDAGTAAISKNAAALPGEEKSGDALDTIGHLAKGDVANAAKTLLKSSGGLKSSIAKGVGNFLQRMSPFTEDSGSVLGKVLPALGAVTGTSPNVTPNGQGQPNMQSTATMQPQGGQAGQPQQSQVPMSPMGQTYSTAMGMMTMDPYLASSLAPVLAQLAPTLQKAQGAAAALPATEQAYQAAGGGQGLIPGLLSRLGGMLTGGPAATYSDQSNQLAQQLNALGIPSSYIPQITQSGQSGMLGFQELQQLIQSMGGGVLGYVPSQ